MAHPFEKEDNNESDNRRKNKELVLKAFDALFNKRDYGAAERYWSPNYIQHSAHIEPGREGLFKLIKSMPPTLKYESREIVAEKDFVMVHGRFSGFGGGPRLALDLEELDLVDVEGVCFLNACEAEGISVLHCSPYIREWMLRERGRSKSTEL